MHLSLRSLANTTYNRGKSDSYAVPRARTVRAKQWWCCQGWFYTKRLVSGMEKYCCTGTYLSSPIEFNPFSRIRILYSPLSQTFTSPFCLLPYLDLPNVMVGAGTVKESKQLLTWTVSALNLWLLEATFIGIYFTFPSIA